jgi:hypothetical protein
MNKALIDPFPKELDDPSTAWSYLRRRFPLYFQGVGRLPGEVDQPKASTTINNPHVEQDVITFAVYALQETRYTLADISEALTGKREYGGAVFSRVKAVRDFLENTTTTPDSSQEVDFEAVEAA